jgi:hypothetical protein
MENFTDRLSLLPFSLDVVIIGVETERKWREWTCHDRSDNR